MKKLLIVGSNGFIGSHCVDYFRSKFDVFSVDINKPNDQLFQYAQIKTDSDFLKILSDSEFEYCINASGSASVPFSLHYPEIDRKLNVYNVRLMLDAIRKVNKKCKFINFSSASVYGQPTCLPVNEEQKTEPISPYAKHKLEAELLMKEYAEKYNLATSSLRVFSAYGPKLYKQLFWDIYQMSKKSQEISLFGNGRESRDFIYVDDLLRAIDCVMNNAAFTGECINIASGKETTIVEAAEIFLNKLSTGCKVRFTGKIREGDPLNWRADISKLIDLGFKQSVALEKGLENTAKFYLQNNK